MKIGFDHVVSGLVGVAALTVTVAMAHQEFRQSRQGRILGENEKPAYVEGWERLLELGRTVGKPNAKVKIVVFADLECPFCARLHRDIRHLRETHPADIAMVFIHFPLSTHRFARLAARGAECAATEGRFESYLDEVFDKQDSLGLKSWGAIARETGIKDSSGFDHCLRDTVTLGTR